MGASRATGAAGAAGAALHGDPEAATWRTVLGAPVSPRTWRGLALFTVLVVLVVLLGSTVRAWVQQRSEISAMREQVVSQERSVTALQQEQSRWQDDAFVEQQARQRLKFVKPGERPYTVLDPPPTQRGTATSVATSADAADLPWYGAVWESMRLADAPASRP
ncbi:MAG TPA: septum formation initiator family protein [Dermatophilaceae bacterium]|nr:septum formation initiator family protein [Dermatophilaceae bacterium]